MVDEVLTTTSRPLEAEAAAELVHGLYGIAGTASPLTSERDQNFCIEAADARYLLKISNAAEPREVTNFQTEAMRHIERVNPDLPVPRVLTTQEGDYEPVLEVAGEAPRVVRLMTFMSGRPLHTVDEITVALRRNLGAGLAELGLALRAFEHPADEYELLWDLKQAAGCRDLLQEVPDAADRALAVGFLDAFEQHVSPVLGQLRSQVVHNDLNFYNVLVADDDPAQVTGLIDFGDMIRTPLVCDLAVAAAYQLTDDVDPFAGALEFIGAYNAVVPLESREIAVLFDLIATRLVATVAITGWRAARHPENSEYILRNNPAAWRNLRYLQQLGRGRGTAAIAATCGRNQ